MKDLFFKRYKIVATVIFFSAFIHFAAYATGRCPPVREVHTNSETGAVTVTDIIYEDLCGECLMSKSQYLVGEPGIVDLTINDDAKLNPGVSTIINYWNTYENYGAGHGMCIPALRNSGVSHFKRYDNKEICPKRPKFIFAPVKVEYSQYKGCPFDLNYADSVYFLEVLSAQVVRTDFYSEMSPARIPADCRARGDGNYSISKRALDDFGLRGLPNPQPYIGKLNCPGGNTSNNPDSSEPAASPSPSH